MPAFRPASFLEWRRHMFNSMAPGALVECPDCNGTGHASCIECDGTGEEECCSCGHVKDCETCDGEGRADGPCDRCDEGQVARSDLNDAELDAYLTRDRYLAALMEDAHAFAAWFNRDTAQVLMDAGLAPYCIVIPGHVPNRSKVALYVNVDLHTEVTPCSSAT